EHAKHRLGARLRRRRNERNDGSFSRGFHGFSSLRGVGRIFSSATDTVGCSAYRGRNEGQPSLAFSYSQLPQLPVAGSSMKQFGQAAIARCVVSLPARRPVLSRVLGVGGRNGR